LGTGRTTPSSMDTRTPRDSVPGQLSTDAFLADLWPVIWESMGDGLSITDRDGRLVYVTPSFCRLLGYAAGELMGRELLSLAPSRLRARYAQGFEEAIGGPEPGFMGDFLLQHKEGGEVCVNVRYSRLILGTRVLHAFFNRDVTRQRELERQLLQADRMRALGTLAGGVAHEFNNLLVSILGYGEMIEELRPMDGEAARVFARKIQRAARRGRQLTAQLLPFARKEEVGTRAEDIHEVLGDVVGLLRAALSEDVSLDMDLGARRSWVLGNRLQLQQVFLNLLTNARDAMPRGGRLEVATTDVAHTPLPTKDREPSPWGYLRVRVSDTGEGMDPEVLRRAFEPFFSTRASGEGAGLGLALVYSAVRNHGGQVSVHSEPGHGVHVDVYLPCLEKGPGII